MKSFTPLPHWVRDISRALVVFVNEYRTSITCTTDDDELTQYLDMSALQFEHKKALFRSLTSNGGRGCKRLACKNEEDELFHPASECPDARFIPREVYASKVCQNHQGGTAVFNQDVVGATQI
ncbi:hypothetical protein VTP01DRAFT_4169 [Rhizomucor pusillus]|uniref:uncharacterized protein n=1 Tax=Rhizomucor pusillus TaxID=4840 RepID=UPI003744A9A1